MTDIIPDETRLCTNGDALASEMEKINRIRNYDGPEILGRREEKLERFVYSSLGSRRSIHTFSTKFHPMFFSLIPVSFPLFGLFFLSSAD